MHPMTAVPVGAGAAYGGLVLIRVLAMLGGMFFVASVAVVNALAWAFPGVATIILPGLIAYVGFRDVLQIGAYAYLFLFYFGWVGYQLLTVSMILAVLWGAQRRVHGRPFVQGHWGAYRFATSYFSPSMTRWWPAWLLSTLVGCVLAAFVTPEELAAFASRVWSVARPVLDWLHEEGGLHNLNGWVSCASYFMGWGCSFWEGMLVFPNGLLWLILFLAAPRLLILVFGSLSLLGMRSARKAYLVARLAVPGIILFLLTTTYVLHPEFWLTWLAWGLYGLWLAKEAYRPAADHPRLVRIAVAGILVGLLVASDVDWALKQYQGVTIFGTTDQSALYERMLGNPAVAYGGVPRLLLGTSPTGWVVERLSTP